MKKGIKILIINIVLVFVVLMSGLYLLFNVYFANITNHGEEISVPDLMGMHVNELDGFVKSHSLQVVITDTTYEKGAKPETVVAQRPKATSMVKEGRKIYVSINTSEVPNIEMPKLVGESLENAKLILQNKGFILDDSIHTKNSAVEGVVLEQMRNGKEVKEGEKLPKGEVITLVVSKKGATIEVVMQNFVGDPFSIAKRRAESDGLIVGNPIWDETSTQPHGTVIRQKPAIGTIIMTGEIVDFWVAGKEPEKEKED